MEHAIVFILCHANGTWTEEEVVVTKERFEDKEGDLVNWHREQGSITEERVPFIAVRAYQFSC